MGKCTLLSLLSALLASSVPAQCQPQYRVTVGLPVSVSNASNRSADVFTVLCFREAFNTSEDISYCPLGSRSYQNNFSGDPVELPLSEGADDLAAAYPTTDGVGLLVEVFDGITDNILATGLFPQLNATVGVEFLIGPNQEIANGILITGRFTVNCDPGLTGPDCTTQAIPNPPTHDLDGQTENQTQSPGKRSPPYSPTSSDNKNSNIHSLNIGIKITVGFLVSALIIIFVGAIAITYYSLKSGRKRGAAREDSIVFRNPVYSTVMAVPKFSI